MKGNGGEVEITAAEREKSGGEGKVKKSEWRKRGREEIRVKSRSEETGEGGDKGKKSEWRKRGREEIRVKKSE